jgi:transcriptional regulator with XRE-family HTH domain
MEPSQAISIRNRIIGVLVKRARLGVNKSLRECAEFLGCSPSMFSQYEQGKKGLSLPELEALAYFLEVPATCLWDEEQAPSNAAQQEPPPIEQLLLLRRKMLAVQFRQCRQETGLSQRALGELMGCSAYTVSSYEHGKRDIPLAQLELAAEQCGWKLADLLDEETIPLSPAQRERQALGYLDEMPPEVRDFVLNPTHALYLRVAMLLSALKADSLRQIAETILDITY